MLLIPAWGSAQVADGSGTGQRIDPADGATTQQNQSVHWYIEGARQGYASSQYQLGKMYQSGEGVEQDFSQAARWFSLAAMQDYASAQYALGELYRQGTGVEMDYPAAYAWYHVAAMNRFHAARDARDRLALLMDANQISLAHWQVKKIWKRITAAQARVSVDEETLPILE